MTSLPSRLRSLLVALAVLAGLIVPLVAGASAADAAMRYRTCKYAYSHSAYRHHHRYWWKHHCPHLAAKLATQLAVHHGTAARGRPGNSAPAHFVRAAATHSAPTGSTVTRGTGTEQQIAVQVLNMINAERRANHVAPVSLDRALVVSAQRHNVWMAHYNTMSHQLPGEADLGRRIDAAGYHWMTAGENVAWNSAMNSSGVQAVQNMMYNEKAPNNGHRLNILNAHFHQVGVNVFIDAPHHKVWLTTDFGSL